VRKIFPWLSYTKVFGFHRTVHETKYAGKKMKCNKNIFEQYRELKFLAFLKPACEMNVHANIFLKVC
jgi:hypothetical protein